MPTDHDLEDLVSQVDPYELMADPLLGLQMDETPLVDLQWPEATTGSTQVEQSMMCSKVLQLETEFQQQKAASDWNAMAINSMRATIQRQDTTICSLKGNAQEQQGTINSLHAALKVQEGKIETLEKSLDLANQYLQILVPLVKNMMREDPTAAPPFVFPAAPQQRTSPSTVATFLSPSSASTMDVPHAQERPVLPPLSSQAPPPREHKPFRLQDVFKPIT